MLLNSITQGTNEWLEARKGVVTGTGLKKVMGSQHKKYIAELIAETYEDTESYTSDAMLDGNMLEPWAIDMFELETGKRVRQGLFYKDGDVGLSPDGVIGKDAHEAVEAKCPELKEHIHTIITNQVPSQYKWQIVHYFVVLKELKTLYFVSYHPTFHKKIHIIEVTRESLADDIEKAEKKLKKFLEEYNQAIKLII